MQSGVGANPYCLSEVAFALGFADQSHFTRRFRQMVGISPGQFRSCNILAHLVGRHSTIRRIASRHYSAEGLLRVCRRLQLDLIPFEIAASTFLDRRIIQET